MTVDSQTIRRERYAEIGAIIVRDAGVLIDRWAQRAGREQPHAGRAHHDILLDHLPGFLAELGAHLNEAGASADVCRHRRPAEQHGSQRWEAGWSLTEVVRDYRLLRLIVLEHLDEGLDRQLRLQEIQAVGLAIDEAIEAGVERYVRSRDEQDRRDREAHEAASRAAAAEMRRWKDVFLQASWGVAIADASDSSFLAVNPAFARMHGYAPAELEGKRYADLIAPDHRSGPAELIRPAVESGRHAYEAVHVRKDGTPLPVQAEVTAYRGEDGRVIYWAANFQDVSGRRQLEDSLRRQADNLRDADRKKDQFLATLAHELRNSLAPLSNALDLLAVRGDDPVARAQDLELARRQLRQMTLITDDLMDLSRVRHGKVELRKERVDLGAALIRAVETARPAVDGRGHALTVAPPPEPVWVEADPARLEQIFVNLLTNAAKYTEPGGRIRASVEREGDGAVVRVRDTGRGLDREALGRIFDLFAQVEGARGQSQGGLGIGLALVKGLVELHGGSVAASSDGPGQGSEFAVCLPALGSAVPAAPAGGLPGRPDAPAAFPRALRVLVVDDNQDAAEGLATLLRAWGHEAGTAADGPAALEAAAEFRPEVVLLDIGLPGLDGYEVGRRLRANGNLAGLILVALTGYGREEDRLLSREAGFDHHLVKPVDAAALRDILIDHQVQKGG